MSFLPIPAIDLLEGKIVRLRKGKYDEATVYSDEPAAQAAEFARLGARRLHIVDLDGARSGASANREAIRALIAAAKQVQPELEIQVGGGLRRMADVDACLEDADYAVLGTAAIADEEFLAAACARHPKRIILGLDARDGMLAVQGWEVDAAIAAVDYAQRVRQLELAAVVHTDIGRDGMLSGPNCDASAALQKLLPCPVIVSGGIASIADIERARAAKLGGAIIGKAIYEQRIDPAALFN